MIIFMVQGRDIENKVSIMARYLDKGLTDVTLVYNAQASVPGSGCEFCGNSELWWSLGDTTDTHLQSQSQCGQVTVLNSYA